MEKRPSRKLRSTVCSARGVSRREDWKKEKKDNFTYKVLGGTHLPLASKTLHEKYSHNQCFIGYDIIIRSEMNKLHNNH